MTDRVRPTTRRMAGNRFTCVTAERGHRARISAGTINTTEPPAQWAIRSRRARARARVVRKRSSSSWMAPAGTTGASVSVGTRMHLERRSRALISGATRRISATMAASCRTRRRVRARVLRVRRQRKCETCTDRVTRVAGTTARPVGTCTCARLDGSTSSPRTIYTSRAGEWDRA
jgi:hypothetical protein